MTELNGGQDRPVEALPSADTRFDALKRRIGPRKPALFLDFDGTLTPIVSRPDLVSLNAEARLVIGELASRLPVAVVSGRERSEVEQLVAIAGLSYAGGHGFDIRTADGRAYQHPVNGHFTEAVDRAESQLRQSLDAIGGALVERKARSVAIHFRLVEEADLQAVTDAVARALADEPGLTVMNGKKVMEIEPEIDWNKGRAVLWLLSALGLEGAEHVPIFIGDDVTDERAFEAILPDGIGIIVADPTEEPGRRTSATFRVNGPDAVVAILRRLGGT